MNGGPLAERAARRAVRPAHRAALVCASLVCASLACEGATPRATDRGDLGGDVGQAASAIIGGEPSGEGRDAVVLIKHYDAIRLGGGAEGCTGTMLTPRLVLTARHCVAETGLELACDSTGRAIEGGEVRKNFQADKLFVFAGAERPNFLTGLDRAARAAEIIDDGADNLCDHDIALLVLASDLPGARVAPVRLASHAKVGERVTTVGWGVTEETPEPAQRMERAGVEVLAVGPAEGVGPSELLVGESGCSGDSGGPALSESGAVIGVLSRGGNGSGAAHGDPAGCTGARNVFVSVFGHADLVRAGYARVGASPWEEGAAEPPAGPSQEDEEEVGEASGGCGVAVSRGIRAGAPHERSALAGLALVGLLVAQVRRARRTSRA